MLVKRLRRYLRKLISHKLFKKDSNTNIPILILARGGSKRIPGKNLVELSGVPLLYYSIKRCKEVSNLVVVSSDSEEILNYAYGQGAIPLPRPAYFAEDFSSSEDAIKHFLTKFATETVVLVQPTSPFVRQEDISEAIALYRSGEYDSVATVWPFRGKLRYYDQKTGKLDLVNLKEKTGNGADNLLLYRETGAVYVTSRAAIMKGLPCINGRVGLVKVSLANSIDIDEYEDLALAEIIMKGRLFV